MDRDHWLKELYDANYERLYRLAARQLRASVGHISDAQDVLQEVFMLAAQKDIRNHPNPEGWLVLTTVNVCNNFIRTVKVQNKRQRECAEKILDGNKRNSLIFIESMQDDTKASDVRMTLEQITTPEERAMLNEYCVEGHSVDDIARKYALSPNAVRVRIHRLRTKLKNIFQDL